MNRIQLLAAEIFGYSYANYKDHLGIGNVRFDEMMPRQAEALDKAETENWAAEEISRTLDISLDQVPGLRASYQRARSVVDAPNPAESFRTAVRQCVDLALDEGLSDEESREKLVKQICYRASDLGFLLKSRGESLNKYSRHLRKDADCDYYDGYFEEEDD